MSFGLPEPLQTPFELTNDLPASTNEPDAATLTLHALDWLNGPKTSRYIFEYFQTFKHFQKLANLGGGSKNF